MIDELRSIIEDKKTQLCLSADVTASEELIEIAETLGPYICVLKTHIDILEDFTPDVTERLQKIAKRHRFVIFEDRKFADIGSTVLKQYSGGMYRIADWAAITNAHIIPGEGIIEGLKKVGGPKGNGLLLLAQMSSKGSLAAGDYTKKCVELAKRHSPFVIGFICTERLIDDPRFIHMTPGVKLGGGSDALGQQYLTPEVAILERKTDIIIVGRGITQAPDRVKAAIQYRDAAWNAYTQALARRYV
jgi:uridine monophosphate synthetase